MVARKTDYTILEGSLHEKFWFSRAKIQFFGGAYANGKSTAMIVKALNVARDYPGCRILMARANKIKLRTTLQRDFFAWCPPAWIKRWNKADGELEFHNGTVIDFKYIGQKSGGDGQDSTSNILSATYSLICVDQIEDPELVEKDIDDLVGRLRDTTPYDPIGERDLTMPESGPRWLLVAANPTGNWVYHKFVKPMYDYRMGIANNKLMVHPKTGLPIIELFEGSTYDNKHNLTADFIETMEATYTGQMRDRYLLGKWVSYEGMVYPQVRLETHFVPHMKVIEYYQKMRESKYIIPVAESYDHGLRSPSCYLSSFIDDYGNIIVMDGYYKAESTIHETATAIRMNRMVYGINEENKIFADPAVFRRTGTGDSKVVGVSVKQLFEKDEFLRNFVRGTNSIASGIAQVGSYLNFDPRHKNPFTGEINAPRIYFSDKLMSFLGKEIVEYKWKVQKANGEIIDEPVDKNDHSLDALKYMVASRPQVAKLPPSGFSLYPMAFMWYVQPKQTEQQKVDRSHRHG